MNIRLVKPVTPGRRGMKFADRRRVVASHRPYKNLVRGGKQSGGRNNRGVITIRARGGSAKQLFRKVDFKQRKLGVPGVVRAVEYDPKRTAYIAHIVFADGEHSYILAPQNLSIGDKIVYNETTKIKLGNRLMLKNIPVGMMVYNVELTPGKGGQIVRSAGTSATLMGIEGGYAALRLPSGEVRKVLETAFASIGVVSNSEHMNIKIGKAGRHRWMGHRPRVRGKAKNPVDHPHGGGEGGSPIGLKHPKTPTGKPALGYKTRNYKKSSGRLIVKPRSRKKK
ncbi:50S ribosomal protein L2 [candidate division Kazan bacterium]|uniref:Large ribosomal subunit protein uL2 n=1 Tax=candidate division Kazan bacterium TaxID=2202143 RepID=A0A420ZE91_UNCK3|nr:MAG: 50S ribosomal protein L2 [candidate division Kazan bacterium]